MEILEAALWYLKLGYSVIPLQPKGKKPLLEWKPYQQQKATKEEIASWWQKWPEANVGIVTGAISGLLVLDIDGWEGEQTIRYKGLYCPSSIISRTGGGNWHYLYRHPGFECRNYARQTGGTLSRGLDFMGDGDYMVAPPSIHHSGNPYKWYVPPREAVPVEPPPWLLQLIQNQPRGKKDAHAGSETSGDDWTEELTSRAVILLKKGIPPDEASIILQAWGERRYSNPPGIEEVLEIVQKVVNKKYIDLNLDIRGVKQEDEPLPAETKASQPTVKKEAGQDQEHRKDTQKTPEKVSQTTSALKSVKDKAAGKAAGVTGTGVESPEPLDRQTTIAEEDQKEEEIAAQQGVESDRPEELDIVENRELDPVEEEGSTPGEPGVMESITPDEPEEKREEKKQEVTIEKADDSIPVEEAREGVIAESENTQVEKTAMAEPAISQQDEALVEETELTAQETSLELDLKTPVDELNISQEVDPGAIEMAAAVEFETSFPVESSTFVKTAAYLQGAFMQEYQKRMKVPLMETGLEKLDRALGGGLYPGLHLLGGDHSFGKTALVQQLADHVAAGGHQVLFFSLEMGRYEMTCRSLARTYFEASGDREVTTGDFLRCGRNGKNLISQDQIVQLITTYQNGPGKNLTLVEGKGDTHANIVCQLVNDHLAHTGMKPVVIVDYLQAMIPLDWRMSEKQAVDYNVVELRRMARDLDIPVIALSLFQQKNDGDRAGFEALLESKTIASTADTVMVLQFRLRGETVENKELKNRNPRPLELVICKNRQGRAYEVIELDYWPKHNYFLEV